MKKQKYVIKFSIVWIFIAVLLIFGIVSFCRNRVFATNKENTSIKIYEENQKSVDVVKIMLANADSNKKIVNEQRDVQFETKYEENANLPQGEEQIKQEGKLGKIQVTALQEYQNEELIDEEIIEKEYIENVVPEIKYIGTSEFLKKYNVHIGDKMYLLETEDLKESASTDSNTICQIPRYLNITINEAGDEWIKVTYNGKEGYLKTDNITSNSVTPIITEKNRIAVLKNNLNIEMDLSKPSGLNLSDFKTVLSNNYSDKNKIFENNAKVFYDIEQKYNINGIFVAAVGIHESAWGTSNIAKDKYNLFGYTAYDNNPYDSATTFDSYENAIDVVAKALSANYLHINGTYISENIIATGIYYNGNTVNAVNTKYASDEEWGTKVYSYMQFLYNKL